MMGAGVEARRLPRPKAGELATVRWLVGSEMLLRPVSVESSWWIEETEAAASVSSASWSSDTLCASASSL
jgi:hypothetical protein